ncbi:MAG: sigma-70 family RNA polymerase sigma factor [Ruminococcaceae bacterium]|jgi:DNA-directed RNA polymerase specialized sigma24 family protein|nr:sigma-70 family RNA polymerase sigma factor [Oscillospiraceae bacterium]
MTREQLEDYPNIVAEIADLQEYLHTVVGDTVQDGSSGYPHPILIRGLPAGDAERRRIKTLTAQKAEIEQFVDGLPTAKERRVFRYRVMDGFTWGTIAAKMGYRYSVDGVKKIYYRQLKKIV